VVGRALHYEKKEARIELGKAMHKEKKEHKNILIIPGEQAAR
jgi:hypothetical protein